MSSNYETLYGVGLLDDLHNYFPALLYDSSSFGSVRDVIGYVQAQTRNRFDLFSYGLREYLSAHPPHVPVAPASLASVSVSRNRTSFAGIPPPRGESRSTLPTPMIPSLRSLHVNGMQGDTSLSTVRQMIGRPLGSTLQVDLTVSNENTEDEEEADEEEEEEENETTTLSENRLLTNALLSLLQLPEMTLARNYRDISTRIQVVGNNTMDQFLQPVVIRPTPEQIELNTSVGHLVSETDQACAICQDSLTEEQDGRKLNACGHWFHKNCIDTWLERDVHCPVCRHDIREPLQTQPTQPPLPPV